MNKTIAEFKGEYAFLSADYPCEIIVDGITYTSATNLFCALKATSDGMKKKIARLSPNKARQKCAMLPPNEYYENNKEACYRMANTAKFDQNPELKKKLLETGDSKLINTVTYRDEWAGVRGGTGKNVLGKVLMELRDMYREENA